LPARAARTDACAEIWGLHGDFYNGFDTAKLRAGITCDRAAPRKRETALMLARSQCDNSKPDTPTAKCGGSIEINASMHSCKKVRAVATPRQGRADVAQTPDVKEQVTGLVPDLPGCNALFGAKSGTPGASASLAS
jgi:hypothetical protein